VIHPSFRDSGRSWDEWRTRYIQDLHEEERLWDWLGEFPDGKETEGVDPEVEEGYA